SAIVRASWSRLVTDLNRSSLDRGPKGVIAEVDYHGRTVYRKGLVPDKKEVAYRLKEYYFPFHDRLKEALAHSAIKGLFDCHSLCGIGPSEAPDRGMQRKDIVLGNNGDGRGKVNPALGNTTCSEEVLWFMKEAFQRAGFSVSMNYPYSGGFIITHYARECAAKGKFFVQIEMNQDLFVETDSTQPREKKLGDVRDRVSRSLEEIAKAFQQ
ncbi:MAG: N-formylglutamate amidohydrolase, partial [Deltaproteobacteria bacterium]|nr:N-formylglutamate amidohydrolase [Deltaproteobacteria bacterium]